MKKIKNLKNLYLFQDLLLLTVSFGGAVIFASSGAVDYFVETLGAMQWAGAFFAGIFFTSLFTTVPAMVVLGELALTMPIWLLGLIGGLGAALGDYIIFHFIKSRIADDVEYLLSFAPKRRWGAIFSTRLFKFFVPFIGAILIASPLPNEMGVAMLGLSRMNDRLFMFVCFLLNGAGIMLVGLAARAIAGV